MVRCGVLRADNNLLLLLLLLLQHVLADWMTVGGSLVVPYSVPTVPIYLVCRYLPDCKYNQSQR
jgi:membrane-bound metal-dependent hydrolase YbcI (DUF457 family)